MEIRQFWYVLSVAKHHNFTRAAEELHTTQPNISKQINSLEEELGTKLFIRNHHSVLPTRKGELFCVHAQKIVDEITALQNDFDKLSGREHEKIDIGVFPFFERAAMGDRLSDFFADTENLFGTVRVMENFDAYKALDFGDIDFAILKLRPEDRMSRFRYRLLIREKLLVMVNKDHKLASRETLSKSDLQMHDFSSGNDYMNVYTGSSTHRMYSSPDALVKTIIRLGGLTFISESSAATIDDPGVRFIPLDPPIEYCTYLIYPRDRKNTGIQRKFIDFATEQMVQ